MGQLRLEAYPQVTPASELNTPTPTIKFQETLKFNEGESVDL